jgi:predicted RNase H-like nuclease (RuvC/YqgF family)
MRTTTSEDKAFIEHIIDNTILESAIDFIKDKFSAEEVYGKDILEIWATSNGFVPESSLEELEEEVETLEAKNKELQEELNSRNE